MSLYLCVQFGIARSTLAGPVPVIGCQPQIGCDDPPFAAVFVPGIGAVIVAYTAIPGRYAI